MLDHVAQAAGIERNDWGLAKKRFDCDEAKPFVDARNYHGSSSLVEFGKIGLG